MEEKERKKAFKKLKRDSNGHLVAPFVWHGKPEDMSVVEEGDWWAQESIYWIEGFTTKEGYHLKGLHYFYLTQVKIKTERGLLIHPWWRDIDEFIIDEWYKCVEEKTDLALYKRRGIGLSALFGAGLPLWRMITSPGSTYLATSNDKPKTERMFNEKFVTAFDALDEWIRPETSTNRQTGHMTAIIKGADGVPTDNKSSIICRQTSDRKKDASAFESERAIGAFIDELFLHDYASEVRQSVQSCLMEGGFVKMAPCVFGGSAGIVSQQGIEEAKKMWDDHESMMINPMFIEGFWGVDMAPERGDDGKLTGKILNFCPNGHSNTEGALAWIEREREFRSKSKDKRPYIGFIKSYPVKISDIFDLNDNGIVPEDIMNRVPAQKAAIKEANPPIYKYDIWMDGNGKANAKLDDNGYWNILMPPKPGEKYIMGIDPIPIRESGDSKDERSDYCASIKHYNSNTYVAYMMIRVKDEVILKNSTYAAQMYYNGALAMIERNRGGEIMKQYQDDGHNNMLASQPIIFGRKGYDKLAPKGYHSGGYNADTISRGFFKYLRNNLEKIWFIEILDGLPGYGLKNNDLLSSMEACEIYTEDLNKRSVNSSRKVIESSTLIVKRLPNGARTTEWVTTYKTVIDGDDAMQERKKEWSGQQEALSNTRG
jgi:hypothetical protein